jgi:hypothetical protein
MWRTSSAVSASINHGCELYCLEALDQSPWTVDGALGASDDLDADRAGLEGGPRGLVAGVGVVDKCQPDPRTFAADYIIPW